MTIDEIRNHLGSIQDIYSEQKFIAELAATMTVAKAREVKAARESHYRYLNELHDRDGRKSAYPPSGGAEDVRYWAALARLKDAATN